MPDYKPKKFHFVTHTGELKSVTTLWGWKAYRSENLFIPEEGRFVRCAGYDNHFVYLVPEKFKGTPSYLCTCGGFAVIVGYDVYRKDASKNSGGLMVCWHHATYGKHADGSS